MFAHIGRQPIFNRRRTIAGYELLCRDGAGDGGTDAAEGDAAALRVIAAADTVFGFERLTGGLPCFVRFTRELLLGDFARLLDSREIVVEVPGSIPADRTLGERLRGLKRAGYTLALDGYSGEPGFDRILPLFHYIKVDFRKTSPAQQEQLGERFRGKGTRLLAGKVKNRGEVQLALNAGYWLFQGDIFARPSRLSRQYSLAGSPWGRLLSELSRPGADLAACGEMIGSDAVLSYLLPRPAGDGGVAAALDALGEEGLRHWVCLTLARYVNASPSDELPRRAYLRGRFGEELMRRSRDGPDPANGFLLGMFSLLDRVAGAGMEELLGVLTPDEALKKALLGEEENLYSVYLQYLVIYEMGNDRLVLPDLHLDLTPSEVSGLYTRCREESDAAFGCVEEKL